MQGALSAISGKFGSAIVLGAFFPSVLFVALWVALVFPLLPDDWPPLQAIQQLDPSWRGIAIVLLPVVVAGILYNLNVPIIRFFEGYPWRDSWIGRRLVRRHRERFRASQARQKGLLALLWALPEHPARSLIIDAWSRHGRILSESFPDSEAAVLPTRLGNAIHAFEDYPADRYGMDAVELWPRLVAKVDKEYLAVLDDAKASFDFMLNSSFLSGLLLAMSLGFGLYYGAPLALPDLTLWWWLEILGFGAGTYLFYLGALSQAGAWGAAVKSVFDLYRWGLLEQLGHRRLPRTREDEIVLWGRISRQMTYADAPVGAPRAYAVPPTSASGQPESVELAIARGVSHGSPPTTVTIQVRNTDRRRAAADVVVIEAVPDGTEYVWGSALAGGRAIGVTGTNPYEFALGDIEANGQLTLTYRVTRPERKA